MTEAETNDQPLLGPEEEDALLMLLSAAYRPAELDAARNQALIEAALEHAVLNPPAEELAGAAALREALDHGIAVPELAGLRAAAGLLPNDVQRSSDLIERALATRRDRPRANVIYAAFGAASLAIAAAAAALLVVGTRDRSESALQTHYELPRSAAPLFNEPFERRSTSARIDVIAGARSRELRENRYLAWGIR